MSPPKLKKILITGGAGFIGSHLTDTLIKRGYSVRILDNFEEQVHPSGKKPSYLNRRAELYIGDIRNIDDLNKALLNIDGVFHEAAAVGVGQSQYEIKRYVDVNVGGTANLLDILINGKHKVKKVIVTTSMTGYGEGNYQCISCGIVRPSARGENQLQIKQWEPLCPKCHKVVKPVKTDEAAVQHCQNIYALTKKMQEDMILNIGKTYNLPCVALRCFNVYGPRQSLSNPYTGVTAIFISRLKNNKRPKVYEDGLQTRDFISVYDVVTANILALEKNTADYQALNIGSGKPITIKEVAITLAKLLGKNILPQISQEYRKNDVRHCYADISLVEKLLGWEPKISFKRGMNDLIAWAGHEEALDKTDIAMQNLKQKGLAV